MSAALAAPPDEVAPSPVETEAAAPADTAPAPVTETEGTEAESAQPPADDQDSEPLLTDEFDLTDTTEPVETESNIAAPVVQPLPPRAEERATAVRQEGGTATARTAPPRSVPNVPAGQPAPATSGEGSGELLALDATEADSNSSAVVSLPDQSSDGAEASTELVESEAESLLWWIVALIGVIVFGVVGWLYTRSRTAPSAIIERPTIAGTQLFQSIEDAKLALTLDILGATRSLRMFTVDYRLRVANRSGRAVRDLAVTPELTSASKGSSDNRGPAVAQGTGDTVRIERVGPHQSEVITGTVQLPVTEIRPILQGSKPLFVPLMQVQLRLQDLPPATHTFIIGLPSATSATRLHPIELDGPPGGFPRLETRQIES